SGDGPSPAPTDAARRDRNGLTRWHGPAIPATSRRVSDTAKTVARSAPHERLARDWALVLTAVGIASEVERRGWEWDVVVDPGDVDRAAEALAAYEAESVPRPPAAAPPVVYGRTWAGIVMAMLLVLASRLAGPRDAATVFFRA